eukprot:snap_masked-scaffold_2-processed-gene-27.64-mRNA-1 protein AED:1.00 eAED:1.00 QI:0/-1/0/0/-1/1/1/0/167
METEIKRTDSQLMEETLEVLINSCSFSNIPFKPNEINYPLFQLEYKLVKAINKKGYLQQSWSLEENICLIGIIFDVLFERGWLQGKNKKDSVWKEILIKYENHLEKFSKYFTQFDKETTKKEYVERNVSTIKRHFKYLKAEKKRFRENKLFLVMYKIWEKYTKTVEE